MPSPQLFARYLAGEATPDEVERIVAWQRGSPQAPIDVEAALASVHQQMDVVPIELQRARRWRPARVGLAAAAAIAAVALVAVLQSERTPAAAPAVLADRVLLRTGVGQRDSVTLPDGSRIVIGPSSTLAVAGRTAQVTGEAHFAIVHDERRLFEVNTTAGVVRDLGTTFTVRTYNSGLSVTVSEGKVELKSRQANDPGVVLNPGDRGHVTSGQPAILQRAVVGSDEARAWSRGALVFRNSSLPEVQDALRRWYGIELRVTGALNERHITAVFEREPVEEVVQVIALALGTTVERRGTTYVLVTPSGAR